jgi:hypothetical protein
LVGVTIGATTAVDDVLSNITVSAIDINSSSVVLSNIILNIPTLANSVHEYAH